ncbi:hypothetical protein C8J56DRAFT_1034460 [Mycena floridula]|nr:hypothetical protein C8J56DRAFT_1034460 [Mycena floridula]
MTPPTQCLFSSGNEARLVEEKIEFRNTILVARSSMTEISEPKIAAPGRECSLICCLVPYLVVVSTFVNSYFQYARRLPIDNSDVVIDNTDAVVTPVLRQGLSVIVEGRTYDYAKIKALLLDDAPVGRITAGHGISRRMGIQFYCYFDMLLLPDLHSLFPPSPLWHQHEDSGQRKVNITKEEPDTFAGRSSSGSLVNGFST